VRSSQIWDGNVKAKNLFIQDFLIQDLAYPAGSSNFLELGSFDITQFS
jgi:hypothetical protein